MGIDIPAAEERAKQGIFAALKNSGGKNFNFDDFIFTFKILATLLDFHYGDIPYPPSQPTALIQIICINESPEKNEFTLSQTESEEKDSSFEWGLNETVKIGASTMIETGLPGIFKGRVTLTAEVDINSHQTWKNDLKQTWQISAGYKVNMPPNSYNLLEMVVDLGQPEGEFEVDLDILYDSGFFDATHDNFTIAGPIPELDISDSAKNPVILKLQQHNLVKIKGHFNADVGLAHYTHVKSVPLADLITGLEKRGLITEESKRKVHEPKPCKEILDIINEYGVRIAYSGQM